jgi:hypothetical protein
MKNIDLGIVDFSSPARHRTLMGVAADITQHGHEIHSLDDMAKPEWHKEMSDARTRALAALPHGSLRRLSTIEVLFIGVSRKFLGQITRHKMEFMSSSLRYADHSDHASFVTPVEISRIGGIAEHYFHDSCEQSLEQYQRVAKIAGHEPAGYLMPLAMSGTLLASATVQQWQHVISQRSCNRCSSEMQYVMLRLLDILHQRDPELFNLKTCGPDCCQAFCRETGKMYCGAPINSMGCKTPADVLIQLYPELVKAFNEKSENKNVEESDYVC